ncbi:hypothetical protein MKZ38_001264 [Zalerion maritima]|uniref:Uncharacterized protein n=1 Tax=Zalerion maritima TaxID=339359 RepID=A0AAD5RQK9_9PEZI|nr:hypothetical protein MKZ38_001264 [Zalerion maritima]
MSFQISTEVDHISQSSTINASETSATLALGGWHDRDTRERLKTVMGIITTSSCPTTGDAYLDYLEDSRFDPQDFIKLIKFFVANPRTEDGKLRCMEEGQSCSKTPQEFVNYQSDLGGEGSKISVDDVFLLLGAWLLMEDCFWEHPRGRRIEIVNGPPHSKLAKDRCIHNLLAQCPLVPTFRPTLTNTWNDVRAPTDLSPTAVTWLSRDGTRTLQTTTINHNQQGSKPHASCRQSMTYPFHSLLDLEEALELQPTKMNAYTLQTFARVEVRWTKNILRHLMLSRSQGQCGTAYVEVFCLPSALWTSLPCGISLGYLEEVRQSYATLFNPYSAGSHAPHQAFLSRISGRAYWCLCYPCRCRKLIHSKLRDLDDKNADVYIDPKVWELIQTRPLDWSSRMFPFLWERIVNIHQYQVDSRPRDFWGLFRDRRNPNSFWAIL